MAGLRISVLGGEKVRASLERSQKAFDEAVKKAVGKSLIIVYRRAMDNLTGRVLNVQTGRLRQSVQTFQDMNEYTGTIGTNVEYAAIHEFGGQTKPHVISPRGKALRFIDSAFIGPIRITKAGGLRKKQRGQGIVFARSVHHPGSTVPARPWLRPALSDSQEEIRAIFRAGLAASVSK